MCQGCATIGVLIHAWPVISGVKPVASQTVGEKTSLELKETSDKAREQGEVQRMVADRRGQQNDAQIAVCPGHWWDYNSAATSCDVNEDEDMILDAVTFAVT